MNLKQTLFMEEWNKLSLQECEEVARSLEEHLPPTFRFFKVEPHACGNQRSNVAFFEWSTGTPNHGNAFFALIPGNQSALLGYDREHPFHPTFEQEKSWREETEQEYSMTLSHFLDTWMTPLRYVSIEPFFLEILATDLSQPRTYHQEWAMWIYEGKSIIHSNVSHFIQKDGFRFSSSDEWEYACASGSRTLFRWGNETPDQIIPMFGHKKLTSFDLHLRQNAFGLFIARNPYQWEFVEQPGIMRGGDGGAALHAGGGIFAAWLTLVSAFSISQDEKRVKGGTFGVHLRRAYSPFSL